MFKYLAILVLALAAVAMAAPPAPEAALRGPAPLPRGDLNTASQLVYSYGGYPAYGYSAYSAVPAYGGYAYYG